MTATSPRPRRRILWILIAAVIVIALAITGAIIAGALHAAQNNPTTAPSTSSSPEPSTSATTDAEPTGCLGGQNRDADMLLAAQSDAPHTSNGAVEMTAAIVRWMYRAPVPASNEIASVEGELFSNQANPQFRDLTSAYETSPNPSGGIVEEGRAFYISTIPGVWHLESYTDDTATVSVGGGYVIDGELSPQLRSSTTFELAWERGAWRLVKGESPRPTQELFSLGTTFTGGC